MDVLSDFVAVSVISYQFGLSLFLQDHQALEYVADEWSDVLMLWINNPPQLFDIAFIVF